MKNDLVMYTTTSSSHFRCFSHLQQYSETDFGEILSRIILNKLNIATKFMPNPFCLEKFVDFDFSQVF